jgi:hypothetical protein
MSTPQPIGVAVTAELSPARRTVLRRRIRLLVAATITYNIVEAVVAITAGSIASSTVLIGFGLDSLVEVASAAAVAWQFSAADPERRERVTLRVIAVSFFALAGYVTIESVRALIGAAEADHSPVGIGLAAVSLLVMPVRSGALAGSTAPRRRWPTPSRRFCALTCPPCCWWVSWPTPHSAGGGLTQPPPWSSLW